MQVASVDFARVEALFFDVDGVMTDNRVLVTEGGELLRAMSIRDGYALQRAVDEGLRVAVITGGASDGVRLRLARLGVVDYYSGVRDKLDVVEAYCQRHDLDLSRTLYMGDDLPDVPVLSACGLACVPADATPEALAVAHYVSPLAGGDGCVREVIERVLKLRGAWSA